MPYTQDDKLISIATPLGDDVLLLTRFWGVEGISRLFSFELSMISEKHSISFEAIIGKSVTVAIVLADGGYRYFNGIISSFSHGRGGGDGGGDAWFSSYRAIMVPWFWVLSKTSDSRIFQNLSTPEIVEKIFEGQGFSDYLFDLRRNYDKREFCVQYRETDFNFVSHLLEEEGIYYYFEHENGKHTMVIADSPAAHKFCTEKKSVRCELNPGGVREEDVIYSLEMTQQIRAAKYTVNDFNFKMPHTDLKAEVPSNRLFGPGGREVYDYPGYYVTKTSGERLARIRIEEDESQFTRITGRSDCRAFSSGYRFTLKGHCRLDMNNKDYVLLSVMHEATEGYGVDSGNAYSNHFECLPHTVPYRPSRLTPKPVVQGTQTAIVVGPSGEELYTDDHGRVKVQFHWDREGKRDDKSSCWIRVSHLWAGTGWGAIFIPRIGQEVIVDFLEGDPDRPIIIGRVYNGISTPPYPLPAEKTKSCIMSNSSPGGSGFNELRFEDRKGKEQFFIHAQKQLDVRVKKDSLEWVGNERHLMVTKDQLEKVGGDKHLTVIGDQNEKIGGTASLTTGQDLQQKVGAKYALEAGQEIHLKAGMKVIIEAGMQISLKVGKNFVDIGPAGVTVKGTMVMINSGGSAGSGSKASPEVVKSPIEADKSDPDKPEKPSPPVNPKTFGPQAAALKKAAETGTPFSDI